MHSSYLSFYFSSHQIFIKNKNESPIYVVNRFNDMSIDIGKKNYK